MPFGRNDHFWPVPKPGAAAAAQARRLHLLVLDVAPASIVSARRSCS